VNWLPVVTSTGKIIYDDVTIQFDVAADGTLTISAGYPKIVPPPHVFTSKFEAGNYFGPSGQSNFFITVSGPGVTISGYTEWSLAASDGANPCTYPNSAKWYVGPIKSNPLYGRIKKAGINTQGWDSFGFIGSYPCNNNGDWDTCTRGRS
jgi:hypothetical protein